MKACLDCGRKVPYDAASCPHCGGPYSEDERTSPATATASTTTPRSPGREARPDGQWLIITGGFLFGVGLLFLFITMTFPTEAPVFGRNAASSMRDFVIFVLLGQVGVGFGFALWALGQILRAISFLPGRND